jgi:hypothetical protein
MNTYEFFMEHFGRHLIDAEGLTAAQGTEKALSSNYTTLKGTPSRLQSGWAVVRPGVSSLQLKITAKGIAYDNRTAMEAFIDELTTWDGDSPRIFLQFEKAPVPISNLFITVDRRLIRICSPKGVASFDMNVDPDSSATIVQRAIWKRLPK